MGIYDRDYYRSDWQGYTTKKRPMKLPFSMVTIIILINVGLYFANGLLFPESNLITGICMMHSFTLTNPLYWFEFLTYGFVHAPDSFWHIFGNMLTLFFLGPMVERRYGAKEFLWIYLIAVIAGGIFWGVGNFIHPGEVGGMLGASGAVTTVVILFALLYPRLTLMLYGIIPIPAWLLGILFIVYDMYGTLSGASNIAHDVHLAGAAFAFIYYISQWNFSDQIHRIITYWKTPSKSKYNSTPKHNTSALEEEVDRILRKITRYGEANLTNEERETLRNASQQYQENKRK